MTTVQTLDVVQTSSCDTPERDSNRSDTPTGMRSASAVKVQQVGQDEINRVVSGPQAFASTSTRPVDFLELSDGTRIEIVRRPGDSAVEFLICNEAGGLSVVDHFDHDGCRLVPPSLPPDLIDRLRLPDRIQDYTDSPTAAELYVEIQRRMGPFIDLDFLSGRIVAAFALSTWFADRLTVVPYLSIFGPPGSGKTTLARFLHAVCRHPLLYAGKISSSVYSLPTLLLPTLLFDEARFNGSQQSEETLVWLRAGNARGVPVSVGGQLVDPFAPKVLCSRLPIADLALSSRALHVSTIPSTRKLEPPTPAALNDVAAYFQSKLLSLRLRTLRQLDLAAAEAACPDSSSRMRDLMFALMLPLADDRRSIRDLKQAFEYQESYARAERELDDHGLLAKILAVFCHNPKFSRVLAGQIAVSIDASRKKVREGQSLSARAVGSILKSFGLQTQKLGAVGRGIELTGLNRMRIHDIMRSYDIPINYKDCEMCMLYRKKQS